MMEELLSQLPNYGALGIIAAVLLYNQHKLTTKLFEVIERNTQVMSDLKNIVERSVERRKDD